MCRCCVTATVTYIWPLACVCSLVVVLCLVGGKRLLASLIAASIWAITRVTKKVTRQLRALLEIFRVCFATFPLTEAVCAVVYVSGLDMSVKGFGGVEDGEAEDTGCMLPGRCQLAYSPHTIAKAS